MRHKQLVMTVCIFVAGVYSVILSVHKVAVTL